MEFKKYLQETREGYSEEKMNFFENQLKECEEKILILENEKNKILKEAKKIEKKIENLLEKK